MNINLGFERRTLRDDLLCQDFIRGLTQFTCIHDAGGAVCDGAVPRALDAAAKTAESVKS